MKPITKRILLAVGTLGLATSVAAYAHQHFHDPEERSAWIMEKITHELELTAPQQEKLEVVKVEIMTARKDMHQDRKQTKNDVLEMLGQPSMDRSRVQMMVDQRLDAMRNHAPQVINALGDFYDSLSPEQQLELREHVEQKMSRFEGRHHQ